MYLSTISTTRTPTTRRAATWLPLVALLTLVAGAAQAHRVLDNNHNTRTALQLLCNKPGEPNTEHDWANPTIAVGDTCRIWQYRMGARVYPDGTLIAVDTEHTVGSTRLGHLINSNAPHFGPGCNHSTQTGNVPDHVQTNFGGGTEGCHNETGSGGDSHLRWLLATPDDAGLCHAADAVVALSGPGITNGWTDDFASYTVKAEDVGKCLWVEHGYRVAGDDFFRDVGTDPYHQTPSPVLWSGASHHAKRGSIIITQLVGTAATIRLHDAANADITDANPPEEDIVLSATVRDEDGLPTAADSFSWRWQVANGPNGPWTNIAGTAVSAASPTSSFTPGDDQSRRFLRACVDFLDADNNGEGPCVVSPRVQNVNDPRTGAPTMDLAREGGTSRAMTGTIADLDGITLPIPEWAWIWYSAPDAGTDLSTYTRLAAGRSTFVTTQVHVGTFLAVCASLPDHGGTRESSCFFSTEPVHNVITAPVTEDQTIYVLPGTTYNFSLADFPYEDEDGDGVDFIQFTSRPAERRGTLQFQGANVRADQQLRTNIRPSNIDTLNLTIPADHTPPDPDYAIFTFNLRDDGDAMNDCHQATITFCSERTQAGIRTMTISLVSNLPSTGTVAISDSTPDERVQLTATATDLADNEGLPDPLTINWQWQSAAAGTTTWADITGQTTANFTPQQAQVGMILRACASFDDDLGDTTTLCSDASAPVVNINRPATGTPAFSYADGNTAPTEGSAVTATIGSITDPDGAPDISTFRWQWRTIDAMGDARNIDGATAISFTPAQAQVGSQIGVCASFTDNDGEAESSLCATAGTVANVNSPPTGTITIGQSLLLPGPITGEPVHARHRDIRDADGLPDPLMLSWQWYVADTFNADGRTGYTAIASATDPDELTLTTNEENRFISACASFTDNGGSTETICGTVADRVLFANREETGAPGATYADGNTAPTEDSEMTATRGTLDDPNGLTTFTPTWQWLQAAAFTTNIRDYTSIPLATAATFTPLQVHVDRFLAVCAQFPDDQGISEGACQFFADAVANTNDAPTGELRVTYASGNAPVEHQVMRATLGLSEFLVQDEDGTSNQTNSTIFAAPKSWFRIEADGTVTDVTANAGSGARIYIPGDEDAGLVLRHCLQYTDDQGTDETFCQDLPPTINVNDAPVAQDSAINAALGQDHQFRPADFRFTDVDNDDLASVRIISTPATGILSRDGTTLAANADISRADMEAGLFAYTPAPGATGGTTTFEFRITDDGDGPGGTPTADRNSATATMTITLVTNNEASADIMLAGTVAEDSEITASAANVADGDGLPDPLTINWQWQSAAAGTTAWVDISGAASAAFTPDQPQVGLILRACARFADSLGISEEVCGDASAAVANVNDAASGAPGFSYATGITEATEESTITADAGDMADPDGLPTLANFNWQWYEADNHNDDASSGYTAITGATAISFAPDQPQVEKFLAVCASFTDDLGGMEQRCLAINSEVQNINDEPTGTPAASVGGNPLTTAPTQGTTITITQGTVDDQDGLFWFVDAWQWQQADPIAGNAPATDSSIWDDIAGATSSTFTPTAAQVGDYLQVAIDITDDFGYEATVYWTSAAPVTDTHLAPVATDNTVRILLGASHTFRAGDFTFTDADNNNLVSITLATLPDAASGALTVDSSAATVGQVVTLADIPDIVYTPATGSAASASHNSFTFRVSDDGIGGNNLSANAATMTLALEANSAAAGTATIAGTAAENTQLAASAAATDPNGLPDPLPITWQWQQAAAGTTAWADIAGAASAAFTPDDDQVGLILRACASFNDSLGSPEMLCSAATAAIANVDDAPTGMPDISHAGAITAPTEDNAITASRGTIMDDDGISTFTPSWQWSAADTDGGTYEPITGATTAAFTPGDGQVGRFLRVCASFSDDRGGSGNLCRHIADAVANINDAPVAQPSSVNATIGANHTFGDGDFLFSDPDGDALASVVLVTVPTDASKGALTVAGAAATAGQSVSRNNLATMVYTPHADATTADAMHDSFTFRINDNGGDGPDPTANRQSNIATMRIALIDNSPASGDISLAGTVAEDSQITASASNIVDTDGLPPGGANISWQWQSAPSGTTTWTDIAGATAAAFTPGDDQVGLILRACAMFADALGSTETLCGQPSAAVTNVPDPASGQPAVSYAGAIIAPTEDSAITASRGDIADPDGITTFTPSWQWSAADTDGGTYNDITGATTAAFTPGDDQVGRFLRVCAALTDDRGGDEQRCLQIPTAVANIDDAATGFPAVGYTAPATAPTEDSRITAARGGIADPDGITTFTATWQWSAADTDGGTYEPITGATAAAFTPGDGQVGRFLRVCASFMDDRGGSGERCLNIGTAVANVPDPASGQPAVSYAGAITAPTEDSAITASRGDIADPDGITTFTPSWQWSDSTTAAGPWDAIAGATTAAFTPGDDQVGQFLQVCATFTDDRGGTSQRCRNIATAVANVNDAPVAQPGSVSATIAASYSFQIADFMFADADGDALASITLATVPTDATKGALTVAGAAATAGQVVTRGNIGTIVYTPHADATTAAAMHDSFTFRITDDGSDGADPAANRQSANAATMTIALMDNNMATGTIAATGTARENATLTASHRDIADADGLPPGGPAVSWQWQHAEDGTTAWADIAGATNTTFTPDDAQVGRILRACAMFADALGTTETLCSPATAAIANVNDAPTGDLMVETTPFPGAPPVAILFIDPPTEDNLYTAVPGNLGDADGLGTISWRWQSAADPGMGRLPAPGDYSDINGATSAAFTPDQAQVGRFLRFCAAYRDGQGTDEQVCAAAGGTVINTNDAPVARPGTVSVTIGTTQNFAVGDFMFDDDDNDQLTSITLVTVPTDATRGALRVRGNPATAGQTVTRGNIATIAYTPHADATTENASHDSFTFRITDDGNDGADPTANRQSANAATMTIALVANSPATGDISVTGTAMEDETLTASHSGIADPNGLPPGDLTIAWQWQQAADGTTNWADATTANPANANAPEFIPEDAQVGQILRACASFADALGSTETLCSPATAAIANVPDPAVGEPVVSYDGAITAPTEDSPITAAQGGIADPDGITNFNPDWQWSQGLDRDAPFIDLRSATGATFTPTNDHVGRLLQVCASFTDDQGGMERRCLVLTGAVANTNDAHEGSLEVVYATPAHTNAPTEDSRITANRGTIADPDGLATFTPTWQWSAADTDGGTYEPITGATTAAFTPGDDEVGRFLRVCASFQDIRGGDEMPCLDLPGAVVNVNDDADGQPAVAHAGAITAPTEDSEITASRGTIMDDDGITAFNPSWQWSAADTDGGTYTPITGATAAAFTPGDDQVGRFLQVCASFADDRSGMERLCRNLAPAVANVNDAPVASTTIVEATIATSHTFSLADFRFTDADGDMLASVILTTVPTDASKGALRVGGAAATAGQTVARAAIDTIVYTPATGATTQNPMHDSFRFQVVDDGADGIGDKTSAAVTMIIALVPNNPARGTVTVTGTASENETLAATATGIMDADGLPPGGASITWQWQQAAAGTTNWADIAAATTASLIPDDDQVGLILRACAMFDDALGSTETLCSAATAAIANVNDPADGAPMVPAATPTDDSPITATRGSITDPDGITNFTPAWQWNWSRTGTGGWAPIAGANTDTYTPTDERVGQYLQVCASFEDDHSHRETRCHELGDAVANVNDAPMAAADNSISVTIATQYTFSAADFRFTDADGDSLASITLISLPTGTDSGTLMLGNAAAAVNTPIDAAAIATLTYTPAAGATTENANHDSFTFRITDDGSDGADPTANRQSATATMRIALVANNPASGTVTVTGTAAEDASLQARVRGIADADGLPTGDPVIRWQWQSAAAGTTAWADIAAATTASLLLGDAQVGLAVRACVLFEDALGSDETLCSPASAAIANIPDPASGQPAVAYTAPATAPTEDSVITAARGTIMDDDGIDPFTPAWQWSAAASNGGTYEPITGATGATFAPGDDEVGRYLQVCASFADDQGGMEQLCRNLADAVANVNDAPVAAADNSISVTIATQYTFSAADFRFTDADGDMLVSISLATLPDAGSGTLALGNAAAAVNTPIDAAAIATLTYTPAAGATQPNASHDSFTFRITDDGGDGADPAANRQSATATMRIALIANNEAQGSVSVAGTATEDAPLSATHGQITDADGLPDGGADIRWQWQQAAAGTTAWADIAAAAAAAFTPGDAQVGLILRACIRFMDALGIAEQLCSPASTAVANVPDAAAGMPAVGYDGAITAATEDSEITASRGTIMDDDGITAFNPSWQWSAAASNGGTYEPITGANAAEFTPGDDEVGRFLQVCASFADDQGGMETLCRNLADAVANVNDAPVARESSVNVTIAAARAFRIRDFQFTDADGDALASVLLVTIPTSPARGTLAVNGVSASAGQVIDAQNLGDLVYTPAAGATTASPGHDSFTFRITDDGDDGTQNTSSIATATMTIALVENNQAEGVVATSGTATEDATLTASISGITDQDGLPTGGPVINWQWQSAADGTTAWADIADADDAAFSPGDAQVGLILRACALFDDALGNTEELCSDASTAVANVNDDANGQPAVTYAAPITAPTEDSEITAARGDIADVDGIANFAPTWQWSQAAASGGDYADIADATTAAFTPGDAQVGQFLRVCAAFTDDRGGNEEQCLALADAVANINDAPVATASEVRVFTSRTAAEPHRFSADDFTFTDADDDMLASISLASLPATGTLRLGEAAAAIGTTIAAADIPMLSYYPQPDANAANGYASFDFRLTDDGADGADPTANTASANSATLTINLVPPGPEPATGQPVITGTAQQNETLSFGPGTVYDPNGINTQSISWQWQSAAAPAPGAEPVWAAIAGATGQTFTPGQAQVGLLIQVCVSFMDMHINVETGQPDPRDEGPLCSDATAAIVNVNDAPVAANISVNIPLARDADSVEIGPAEFQRAYSDPDCDPDCASVPIAAVTISTLPPAADGVLTQGGTPVDMDSVLPIAVTDGTAAFTGGPLLFTPQDNVFRTAFGFRLGDDDANSLTSEPAQLTLLLGRDIMGEQVQAINAAIGAAVITNSTNAISGGISGGLGGGLGNVGGSVGNTGNTPQGFDISADGLSLSSVHNRLTQSLSVLEHGGAAPATDLPDAMATADQRAWFLGTGSIHEYDAAWNARDNSAESVGRRLRHLGRDNLAMRWDGSGANPWRFWARHQKMEISGTPMVDGETLEYQGDGSGTYIGLGRRIGPRTRLGLALGTDSAQMQADLGTDGMDDQIERNSTSIYPYLYMDLGGGNKAKIIAGVGSGELSIDSTDNQSKVQTDITWSMLAASISRRINTGGGLDFGMEGNLQYGNTSTEDATFDNGVFMLEGSDGDSGELALATTLGYSGRYGRPFIKAAARQWFGDLRQDVAWDAGGGLDLDMGTMQMRLAYTAQVNDTTHKRDLMSLDMSFQAIAATGLSATLGSAWDSRTGVPAWNSSLAYKFNRSNAKITLQMQLAASRPGWKLGANWRW